MNGIIGKWTEFLVVRKEYIRHIDDKSRTVRRICFHGHLSHYAGSTTFGKRLLYVGIIGDIVRTETTHEHGTILSGESEMNKGVL